MAEDFDFGRGFDENDALAYIRTMLPDRVSEKYSDDDILYVVDYIWDFYDSHGLTSLENIDSDDDDLCDADEVIAGVKKLVADDQNLNIEPKDIELIVKGELKYEDSLGNIL